jgi:hypothetical protein
VDAPLKEWVINAFVVSIIMHPSLIDAPPLKNWLKNKRPWAINRRNKVTLDKNSDKVKNHKINALP